MSELERLMEKGTANRKRLLALVEQQGPAIVAAIVAATKRDA